MSAQPLHEPDPAGPADPREILRLLPERWHGQFLAEYRAALDAAHEVWQWQQLREVLHRWSLRAAAYSDPEFDTAAEQARHARPEDLTPLPGWATR
ncbi:DUF6247 family protein [Actinomadura sp. 6N118]|uniref:DUF6247 family protein n=1 Tax=Actinomadura sp. 6N118 TaxID=3375151 RepID=UPI0037961131